MDDFTSGVGNGLCCLQDTPERNIACCPLSPQNTVLNFGNLQLDVSFQGFCVVRFFSVHSHLQVAPKKEIRRCQVWQLRGGQQSKACCSHSATTAMTRVLRTCAVSWDCVKLLVINTGINRRCFWSRFHLLPVTCSKITGKNNSGVVYQCFSTTGLRPGTGPRHQLYWAARDLRKLQYATRFN